MASFNKVILVGNLTRDPEVRYTTGGSAVCDITLAVNHQWTDKRTNERKEEVSFIDVTLWGRTAEIAGEYLAKGTTCPVEGRLQQDKWDDKETGQKRSKLKVVADAMQLLGGRSEGGGGGPGASGAGAAGGNAGARSNTARPAAASRRMTVTMTQVPDELRISHFMMICLPVGDDDVPF
jgi:single-strand DNA-binding protein